MRPILGWIEISESESESDIDKVERPICGTAEQPPTCYLRSCSDAAVAKKWLKCN